MKAAVYTRYGPPEVLQIKQVDKPLPKANEILVRVHASTVSAADWRLRQADPFLVRLVNGLSRPTRIKILGMEFSGVVESIGGGVTRYAVGDHVFGLTGFKFATNAEYVAVPETADLAIKPANVTHEEAAAFFFGAISALYFLRKANIQPGERVLVYGASGSVGVFAVQLAKYFGAHVTAVCSTSNLELAKSLGADEVVDYTREDFSRFGKTYDVIFDAVGKSDLSRGLKSLKRGGFYLMVSGPILPQPARIWASLTGAARIFGGFVKGSRDDPAFLKQLMETAKLKTVIDRRYRLDQIVEAHRYTQQGHKKGHVVILVAGHS